MRKNNLFHDCIKVENAMKIILSRKGFDSSAGCFPSPIFPDGSMLSLPIPWQGGGITYNELNWRGSSIYELLTSLVNRPISENREAHLDPHLSTEIYDPGKKNWRGLFGQVDAAQSHLRNQEVGKGSLFLFFGWFKRVESVAGSYQYVPHAPDLHVLFGWLQVDDVFLVKDIDKRKYAWTLYHPHRKEHYTSKQQDSNTLYVASEKLYLDGQQLQVPGYGCFPEFREELVLTAPERFNERSLRSKWKLPKFFFSEDKIQRLSYHREDHCWPVRGNDFVILNSVGRGQEFVIDISGKRLHEAACWLQKILPS